MSKFLILWVRRDYRLPFYLPFSLRPNRTPVQLSEEKEEVKKNKVKEESRHGFGWDSVHFSYLSIFTTETPHLFRSQWKGCYPNIPKTLPIYLCR